MPLPPNLKKAELREIKWEKEVAKETGKKTLKVQFNPETLRVNFTNQRSGGDQRGGAAAQFVGRGNTRLSLELWFDVTAPGIDEKINHGGDVRQVTREVVHFITPQKELKDAPPGIRFVWGTFLFDGILESIDESLEYFSEDGKPLRARVSLNVFQQSIQRIEKNEGAKGGAGSPPGEQPRQAARQGDTVQRAAARSGRQDDWQAIAAANNIENPRRLNPGSLLDTNIRRG